VASGRSSKLTGQVGEFLVCAELGRRGILATPFAGNVPEFDVIAVGEGHSAGRSGSRTSTLSTCSWRSVKPIDRFYVLSQWRVREIVWKNYLAVMEPVEFRRPNKPESMHWAIHERDLEPFRDKWKLVEDRCRGIKRGRR
jgi:hypothetical protein